MQNEGSTRTSGDSEAAEAAECVQLLPNEGDLRASSRHLADAFPSGLRKGRTLAWAAAFQRSSVGGSTSPSATRTVENRQIVFARKRLYVSSPKLVNHRLLFTPPSGTVSAIQLKIDKKQN